MTLRLTTNTAVWVLLLLAVSSSVQAFPGGEDHGCGFLAQLLGLCHGPTGGHNPAPAPLLAAGIPAFAALGGAVTLRRLARQFVGRFRKGD